MARVEIDQVVLKNVAGALTASSTATVYVYERGTSTPVTVYQTEAGTSTYTQPLSVSNGRIEGWVEAGQSVDLAITDAATTYTQPWEAVSATNATGGGIGLNVKTQYGAKGDGTTNDSAAIQAAIDAASAAGGGIVYFPPGTYICNVVIKSNVTLAGEGIKVSVLKSAPSGGNVISGVDIATLIGKAYPQYGNPNNVDWTLGSYNTGFRDLTIDGNKANNASGWGVKVWGRNMVMRDVEIMSCKSGGLWTEFTEVQNFRDPAQILDSRFHSVDIHNCDGTGWYYNGPHDSSVMQGRIWDNTGWAVHIPTQRGVLYAYDLNSWMNLTGSFFIEAGSMQATAVAATGDLGTQIKFGASTGNSRFSNTIIAQGGIDSPRAPAVDLRGVNHMIDAVIANTPGTGVQVNGASTCMVRLNGYSGCGKFVEFVTDNGVNLFQGNALMTGSQTIYSGTPSASTLIDFNVAGGAQSSVRGIRFQAAAGGNNSIWRRATDDRIMFTNNSGVDTVIGTQT